MTRQLPSWYENPVEESSVDLSGDEMKEDMHFQRRRLYTCELLPDVVDAFVWGFVTRAQHARRLKPTTTLRHRSVFDDFSSAAARGSLSEHVSRVCQSSRASPSAIVASLVYLERLAALHLTTVTLDEYAMSNVFLVAVMLAAKIVDDSVFDNAHFAGVGRVTLARINQLELVMLRLLDFRLDVSVSAFEQVEERAVAGAICSPPPHLALLPLRLRNLGFAACSPCPGAHLSAGKHMAQSEAYHSSSASSYLSSPFSTPPSSPQQRSNSKPPPIAVSFTTAPGYRTVPRYCTDFSVPVGLPSL